MNHKPINELDMQKASNEVARQLLEVSAASMLQEMLDTFRTRGAQYKDNYKMIAPMMRILFPNGVPPEVLNSDAFHLFELKLVKLSRFAISNFTHLDSIQDDGVYSAMIAAIVVNDERKPK